MDSESFADLVNETIDTHTKTLLDQAQRDYDATPDAGSPWPEVLARLRKPRSVCLNVFNTH